MFKNKNSTFVSKHVIKNTRTFDQKKIKNTRTLQGNAC